MNISKFNSELLTSPMTLKDFVHQYHCKKEIFDLQERHTNMKLEMTYKNIFFNNYTLDIFSVGYCYNFNIGYNHSYVYTMSTHFPPWH